MTLSFQDYESFIRIRMAMPNKFALKLHDLELIIVHPSDNSNGIVFVRKFLKLLHEIDL